MDSNRANKMHYSNPQQQISVGYKELISKNTNGLQWLGKIETCDFAVDEPSGGGQP